LGALDFDFDVAVVGAGPAGATAARHLARGGLSVALIEACSIPRYKTCGGGLVQRARRALGPDFAGAGTIERECRTIELRFGTSGRSFLVRREEPIVTMTMRDALDARLVRLAAEAGVRVLPSLAVESLRDAGGSVELGTARGTLVAGHVVAADGVNSSLARAAGWRASPAVAPALECEVRVDRASFERLAGQARFDVDTPPGGYAWVFPKRAHLSIGLLRTRRGRFDLKAALRRYLEQLEVRSVESVEQHGATIPLAPRPGGSARGRVLLVGDAAGFADPITAEGIGPAIESARLAADALLAGAPAGAGERYQRALAATLLPELRAARRLARLLYRHRRARDLLFRWRGPELAEAMTDVVMGERTYRGLLGSPASYAHLVRGTGERRRPLRTSARS